MNWMPWWLESQYEMTEAELRQLAIDIMDGRVFGTWNVQDPRDIGMVFMTLAFGARIPACVAQLYEYLDKAGPRSINGMPSFFSCRLLSRKMWFRLVPMLAELERQREEFLKETVS